MDRFNMVVNFQFKGAVIQTPVARLRRHSAPCGFTLVELLTASVVMGFTLLAVYTVFRQALVVEQNLTSNWRDRASAEQVAEHLAESIERIVILPEISPLRMDKAKDGEGRELLLTVLNDSGSVEWRRYHWGLGDDATGRLFLQRRPFAGSQELTHDVSFEDLSPAQQWERIDATVIAEDLDHISVQARMAGDQQGKWKEKWNGLQGALMVRIRVRVDGKMVERLVGTRVTTPVNGADQGGG